MGQDTHILSVNIGALTKNTKVNIARAPSDANGGGIRVVAAFVQMQTLGTPALNIVDMGTAGTAVEGTIATKGSAALGPGTPYAFTVTRGSGDFVDADHYIGVEEANVNNTASITVIEIHYLHGR